MFEKDMHLLTVDKLSSSNFPEMVEINTLSGKYVDYCIVYQRYSVHCRHFPKMAEINKLKIHLEIKSK